MTNKLISVIIPVKNGANYIEEALIGILRQNMNIEIIVVDDASSDKTVEIANEFGCNVIRHNVCGGPVVAKNSGIKIAKGDYVLFHDHDDVMVDGALKQLYDEMERDRSVFALMAKVKDFESSDINNRDRVIIKDKAYYGLFSGAVLLRKEVFDIIGLFDESITAGEILSFNIKMQQNKLIIKKINLVATQRRIHDYNFGRLNKSKEFIDYLSILRSQF